MAAEGVIEDASPAAFVLDRFAMPADDADGVALSVAKSETTAERLLLASRSVAAGDLVVGVTADTDRAFARLERPDGSVETFGALRDDVSTGSCSGGCQEVCGCVQTCCVHGDCSFCCETGCFCIC